MKKYNVQEKSLKQWLKILGWSGGTINQVDKEINDQLYILRKLKMIEGLNYWDKVRINKNEAKIISLQNGHNLPRIGKKIIHSRQAGIGNSFIGKDEISFFIGLC